ncbi:Alpha-glucosidase [Massilia sp. 9I]|nr:Alpha-glucosidase [Massilia sp. 9I]
MQLNGKGFHGPGFSLNADWQSMSYVSQPHARESRNRSVAVRCASALPAGSGPAVPVRLA